MSEIQYIDTPDKLEEVCRNIEKEPWIAIDTEFLREKTYYPKFCLMQIATPDWVVCIDPIALPDLDRLFDAIYSPSIIKVLHSCRQDLEIFYHLSGKVPGPIFDTQLAAPLLGMQENCGYAMLVSSFLNVNLGKAHTRTDWSIRPLRDEQLKYSADDVIYLGQVYQLMLQKLTELGRIDWLKDDFSDLENPDLYLVSPEKAWLRIKGKNKLSGKQLSVLQILAEWRETTAQVENRPRNWLLRDDLILDLSKLRPTSIQELANLRNMNERTIKRYGKIICQKVAQAESKSPVKLNDRGRSSSKTQQQEAILDVLSGIVRIRAEENSLNPAVLASRKDLEKLLFEDPDCKLLHGWRYAMAGRELTEVLNGKKVLSFNSGRVQIMDAGTEEKN